MRALVIGSRGQLGTDLMEVLERRGDVAVTGVDFPEIDITDADAVESAVAGAGADVVVNCAAWTAVDDAEADEAAALRVNGIGPRHIARSCARTGSWLVQISTDYVFDGTATVPYAEAAVPNPASAYGRTKLAGEEAVRAIVPASHYVVRTAWLYGRHGSNFVKTMLRAERERDTVAVVTDQRGQPTYARDLAEQVVALVDRRPAAGTFHGTNSGETTWWEFTREVFRLAGADPDRVEPTTSARFPRPAPRPAYSVLGHDRWAEVGLAPMRPWRAALADAFAAGLT